MGKLIRLIFLLILFPGGNIILSAQSLTAKEVVRRAEEKFRGEKSSYAEMSLKVIRPEWQRTIEFKTWAMGSGFAISLITSPPREAGQSFLKRGSEMWSWNPSISRIIKLPPSMLSQGWMGSDYTHDDILKETSAVNDYSHEITGEEEIEGRMCYKIEMTALEKASVIWGKQVRWIDRQDFLVLKAELYDEDGYLVRTETCSDIRIMDGRSITSKIELVPEDEPRNKTVLEIRKIRFNIPVEESFFSQQNMKRLH
ncbi:MAG TPA: outer membrane lipoprotein-sorting protein [Bacteroidales bacterium]|jgi:outer membrane lipoprotein-sorting protein|nr:outer membrane lipoprotein-sorting protein [Bacteroidales bacterium]HOS73110.1 outer membrane lipoprotein-sorting protein [Bacteroidales bacterium]HQH23130.1 outer membrane lipoprotein-sorting protein [Bacteroidales bacterium]HQJ81012.1 outer membrane lipoprotein-sorting protein [Bacteroidales bacterium]